MLCSCHATFRKQRMYGRKNLIIDRYDIFFLLSFASFKESNEIFIHK